MANLESLCSPHPFEPFFKYICLLLAISIFYIFFFFAQFFFQNSLCFGKPRNSVVFAKSLSNLQLFLADFSVSFGWFIQLLSKWKSAFTVGQLMTVVNIFTSLGNFGTKVRSNCPLAGENKKKENTSMRWKSICHGQCQLPHGITYI